MINWKKLGTLTTWLFALVGLTPFYASAQGWQPSRPIEYAVPSGPGAALDAAARKLKDMMERRKLVTQPIIVSNKSGGGGTVAINTLVPHPGDAHWLTTFTTGMVNVRAIGEVPVTYAEMTPIVMLFEEAIFVAVRADSPLKTGRDLVEKLKAQPASLSIAIATSVGNHIHIAIAKPLKTAGVDVSKLTIVPYKSSGESMTSLLGGHVDVVSASSPNLLAQYQAGTIRLLAVATDERLPGLFAAVPTWKEQGINASYTSVQGVLGPKGLTAEQVNFWERALSTVTESEEWSQFLAKQSWRPRFMKSAEFKAYIENDYAATKALIDEFRLTKK